MVVAVVVVVAVVAALMLCGSGLSSNDPPRFSGLDNTRLE